MIKVGGTGGAGNARPAKGAGAAREGGTFRVEGLGGASGAAPAAQVAETQSSAALGALIALQGDGRSRARNRAAADRALLLLERIRDGLVEGRIAVRDLEAIADAAHAKLEDPDDRIAALYSEIALRARVELAKLGR